MIKMDYSLYLADAVLCQCQSGVEQRLLCREHFQVVGGGVAHKQACLFGCSFEVGYLPAVQVDAPVGGLPFGERVVYLLARIEQCLFKAQRGFLLPCLGDFQVGDVRTL